jgi:hypothetical protein
MTLSYVGTLPDSIDHSQSIITPPGWVTPNEALLSTARKGIKMRLGLSEPARVGRTMQ